MLRKTDAPELLLPEHTMNHLFRTGPASYAAVVAAITLSTPQSSSAQHGPFESRMFRFDPTHTGVVTTQGVPVFGGVAWTFETQGQVTEFGLMVNPRTNHR